MVRGLERQRNRARNGCLVHNGSFGFEQERQKCLRDGEVGPHVEIEQFLRFGDREIGHGDVVTRAGIVNKDVEVRQLADAGGDRGVGLDV